MSPEQQAARDAAIMAAATRIESELEAQYRRSDWEDAKDVLEGVDYCLLAEAGLRTTPPAAAPGEITQEQAREMRDALREALSSLLGRLAAEQGIPWEKRHTVLADPASIVGRARAALAGVPRE